jgi:hypothetical protein
MINTTNFFFISYIFLTGILFSQELDPWAYGNLPTKLNMVGLSYSLIDGNFVSEPSAPIQDFNVTTSKVAAVYLRTFNLFGKLGRVQVSVPFSFMSGNAKLRGHDTSGSRTGFDDLRIRLGLNLFGSPPLEPQKFGTFRQEAIFGISLVVTAPTGQYYPERIVNIGTNRWSFKPELGVSLKIGPFFWETYGGVKFMTTNSEYLSNRILKVSPIYSLQMHICHTFNNSMRLALSSTYVNGGQTSINGNKQSDYMRHLRGGIIFGYSIDPFNSLILQINTNITANASLDYKSITLMYSYSWF